MDAIQQFIGGSIFKKGNLPKVSFLKIQFVLYHILSFTILIFPFHVIYKLYVYSYSIPFPIRTFYIYPIHYIIYINTTKHKLKMKNKFALGQCSENSSSF